MKPIFQREDADYGAGALCEACGRVWEKHKPPLFLCPDNDEEADINQALDGLIVQAYRHPNVMAELRMALDRALAPLRRDAERWRALGTKTASIDGAIETAVDAAYRLGANEMTHLLDRRREQLAQARAGLMFAIQSAIAGAEREAVEQYARDLHWK